MRLDKQLILAVSTLALAVVMASPLDAQESSGTFIVQLGNDTVAVEQYTRTGRRIEGEIVSRVPRTSRSRYVTELDANGRVTSVRLSRYASPTSDSVSQVISLRFEQDSVITQVEGGPNPMRRAAAVPAGTLPSLTNSYAMHEVAALRTRAGDSLSVPFYSPGQAEPFTLQVQRAADNAVMTQVVLPGGVIEHEGRVSAQGQLLELRGVRGSYGSNVTRASRFDLAAAVRDYASRDQAGNSLGMLSPRDTAQAQVGGATISIDYSRPSARGRPIMGGLLEEGSIWRLGANQATHLRTDRDLVFGGHTVPAGTYTLFAIPARSGWTLIVNRQTGQWGTIYDEAQDLVRIPLAASKAPHQEQFTIDVEPARAGGVLRISWGDVRASAPFTVR